MDADYGAVVLLDLLLTSGTLRDEALLILALEPVLPFPFSAHHTTGPECS
jgi:hypothetical protein